MKWYIWFYFVLGAWIAGWVVRDMQAQEKTDSFKWSDLVWSLSIAGAWGVLLPIAAIYDFLEKRKRG